MFIGLVKICCFANTMETILLSYDKTMKQEITLQERHVNDLHNGQ